MIFIADLMYILFMGSLAHVIVATSYALHHIKGESPTRAKKNGILLGISIILFFYYRQSNVDVLPSIPVYASLSIAFFYLAHDAIRDGKRYPKMQKEEAK